MARRMGYLARLNGEVGVFISQMDFIKMADTVVVMESFVNTDHVNGGLLDRFVELREDLDVLGGCVADPGNFNVKNYEEK